MEKNSHLVTVSLAQSLSLITQEIKAPSEYLCLLMIMLSNCLLKLSTALNLGQRSFILQLATVHADSHKLSKGSKSVT